MDFIVDNYFWFIIGGIVVLMIIIGYIAEQTDFGRKPFPKKEKPSKENDIQKDAPEDSTIIPEDTTLNDLINDNSLEEIEDDTNVAAEPEFTFDDNEGFSAEVESENVDESIEEPMPELAESEAVEEDVELEETDLVEDVVTDNSEDDVWKF